MTTPITGDGWEMRPGRWQDSPPDAVDHVISDPPYTDHVSHNQRRGTRTGDAGGGAWIDDTPLSFDGIDDLAALAKLPHTDIVRRWLIAWCAAEQLADYQRAAGGTRKNGGAYIRAGVWLKTNPTPQFTGDRPAQWGEACAILHTPGGRMKWNNGGHAAKWIGPHESRDRVHETQKPLWLMRAQIEQFTDPGDLIWDPYAGSATTGVACLLTGRRFIGHEMQEGYFQTAVDRLRATDRGTTLDAARAGQMTILDAMGGEL